MVAAPAPGVEWQGQDAVLVVASQQLVGVREDAPVMQGNVLWKEAARTLKTCFVRGEVPVECSGLYCSQGSWRGFNDGCIHCDGSLGPYEM